MDTKSHDLVTLFITNLIETHIDFCDLIMKDTNYKDQILRYFQHNYKVHPIYRTEKDDSTDSFICKIFKEDECIETGKGNTKKTGSWNFVSLIVDQTMRFCFTSKVCPTNSTT